MRNTINTCYYNRRKKTVSCGGFFKHFVTNQKNQRRKRIEKRNQRQELRKKGKLMLTSENHNIYYGLNTATGNNSYQSDLCPELTKMRTEFLNQLAEANREKIEKATQLQKESPRWFVERKKQLTASRFGRIYKLQNKTPSGATIAEMINPSFRVNIYTEYGNSREPTAIEEVERKLRIEIKKSGLVVIDENFPFQ
ncbi:hypothetical protein ILUMI_16031 [Ignelater luminosus]|uniref:YqaJ viral recombinase domain-containing protein n=1 Tax=Ignelater luminosus TaxID=2038154 RepID=A0A8K0G6B7_IGNLU|nr:hypothetical protein ILUMI_16031 [Ignelater luminosus]